MVEFLTMEIYFGKLFQRFVFFSAVYTSITLNPRAQTVIEGYMSLNFTCDANGTPSPTYAWVKNGSFQLQESSKFAFFSDGKVLQIKSVTRYDAGNFTCIASNGKSAESSAAVLSVQCKYFHSSFIK